MNRQILLEKIRQSRTNHFISNCYSISSIEKSKNIWTIGDNYVYSYEDHGIQRLVYFVIDCKVLDDLLSKIYEGQYYMEFLTRDPDEYEPIKSRTIARMKRVSNSDCSTVFQNEKVMQFEDDTVGSFADFEDAHEINEIMWNVFDPTQKVIYKSGLQQRREEEY